ncbi:MAG TPA: type VII secretion protein EccB [Micromonosporaceae bacterium]|nr:type VII secretion protein EccB [Micromonosporaceae bacterium]
MPSRQDQLHSYQFMVQRVVAALVMRETDPAQSPFRRAAGATLASMLVAAIALGGVMVYGVFAGGGATNWRDDQAVIVEKESGARYVFYQDKLHPVQNYASALLAVGAQQPRTILVSRKSIAGVPRGIPLGIPDAPDSLPATRQLSTQPWTVCSLSPDGDRNPRSAVFVGGSARGGMGLGERALLAEHPDGTLYVIWRNRRHQVRNREHVLAALTWPDRGTRVAPALLNALAAGADLAPIAIPGRGERSDEVDDATVGEVFVVASQGGGRQYAVATRSGLAVVTEVQANLLLTENGRDEPTQLTQGSFAKARKTPSRVPTGDGAPPASIPELAEPTDGAICGRVADDRGVVEVRVDAEMPNLDPPAPETAAAGKWVADHVIVEPGRGAVVEAAAAPGATGGAVSVVTDLGRRHPLSSADVLPMLGYGQVRPVRMPANLVALVPAGGALDPEAVWPSGRPT